MVENLWFLGKNARKRAFFFVSVPRWAIENGLKPLILLVVSVPRWAPKWKSHAGPMSLLRESSSDKQLC